MQTPLLQPHLSLCLPSNAVGCFSVQQPRHFLLLPPTQRGDKETLLTATTRFPIFVAQITKQPQGAGWGPAAPTHLSHPAHHPLLPSRPRHTTGAEVQDHHRDNGGGAVGALLLPLRRLGDQLHPQGTAATCTALRGTPSHPKNTE